MSPSKTSRLTLVFGVLLCLVVVALPGTALADSAAGDFSIASNPNGRWSYGWMSVLGSLFHADTTSTDSYAGFGIDGWLGNQDARADGIPYVLYNDTNTTPTNNHTTVYQPGVLVLQPGLSNEYAVIRWTAPSNGTFSVAATFSGISVLGDSADVHILRNGVAIFNSSVFGSPNPASYSGLRILGAGDTIDFAVGTGGNGPNEDNTAFSAIIVGVPEPSTVGLVVAGLGCLCSLRFRKRR